MENARHLQRLKPWSQELLAVSLAAPMSFQPSGAGFMETDSHVGSSLMDAATVLRVDSDASSKIVLLETQVENPQELILDRGFSFIFQLFNTIHSK